MRGRYTMRKWSGSCQLKPCPRVMRIFFFVQQVECELFVVGDVEFLHVYLGEDVKRRLGLDHRDAVDVFERVVDELALLVDAPARTM